MNGPETLKPPQGDLWPVDTSDQAPNGPFTFLADPVANSVIGHIHPEEDARREELTGALKHEFTSSDPESDYHYRLLMGLKLVGFDLNPKYESDPANQPLLIVGEEETFDREFWAGHRDFRFIRGEDLINYLLGFANKKLLEEANTFPREFSAGFSEWYSRLEAAVKVDK